MPTDYSGFKETYAVSQALHVDTIKKIHLNFARCCRAGLRVEADTKWGRIQQGFTDVDYVQLSNVFQPKYKAVVLGHGHFKSWSEILQSKFSFSTAFIAKKSSRLAVKGGVCEIAKDWLKAYVLHQKKQ